MWVLFGVAIISLVVGYLIGYFVGYNYGVAKERYKDLPDVMELVISEMKEMAGKVKRMYKMHIEKVEKNAQNYLNINNDKYTDKRKEDISDKLHACTHKLYLSLIHLELIWSLNMHSRYDSLDYLENSLDTMTWDDEEKALGSLFLEAYLFQARALVDIWMYYMCLVLNVKDPVQITASKFDEVLNKCDDLRAEKLCDYFNKEFNDSDSWLNILDSLRNKIAHRDFLRGSYLGEHETLFDKLKMEFPKLQGRDYNRYCENINQTLFSMIEETSQILYQSSD